MQDLLTEIFKKHKIWIEIVSSFGCNKDTAEDIVMEMYIKIQKSLDNGLNIDYDDEYNYFYIFKTLKSMFIDLKRKEAKVTILNIDEQISYFNIDFDVNYKVAYNKILDELNKMYWYDKKVYQLLDGNESVAKLSRKTNIPYHSLYNTYRKVVKKLKKTL
jgi:DNA-directed RNA polymerase specialized sigma24 family protein|tara:strand:+ start:1883 stop:2362 length:480 start_codon:yes stop_codon:yes gene_type:complete